MNADSTVQGTVLQPKGPKPAWAPGIAPSMQAVIEKLVSYGDSPIVRLSAPNARKNHSPTDAVKDLMQENNISAPAPMSDTTGKDIDVAGAKFISEFIRPNKAMARSR
ncbi:MAG: hypothetical protein M3139_05460 [Bacteroidota bacterium]|nr:hypothetical protein [Bacteroidota bacterium]